MDAFTTLQAAFAGAGGVALAGTLTLPGACAEGRRAPAFVLVPGSGPTDRDGNQRPALVTDLLSQVAAILARAGIASLRYDKRGLDPAARPQSPEALAEFVRFRHFVADAAAALAWLRARPEVDPARAGLFGHSEGGLIGLSLAADAGFGPPPAALVLAATPGRPLAAVLRDQLARLGRLQGAGEAVLGPLIERNDAILAEVAATGRLPPPEAIPQGLRALYPPYLAPFLQELAALDPAALAARSTGPVLVLSGAEDVQVSPDRDALALGRALGGRPAAVNVHAVTVLRGASHNFKPVRGRADPGFAGPVDPAFGEALTGWLKGLGWAAC